MTKPKASKPEAQAIESIQKCGRTLEMTQPTFELFIACAFNEGVKFGRNNGHGPHDAELRKDRIQTLLTMDYSHLAPGIKPGGRIQ